MRNKEQVSRKLEDYQKRIEREKLSMLRGTDEFEDTVSDIDINNDKIDLPRKQKYHQKKKDETMGATSRNSHSPDLDDLGKDNIELESIEGSTSRDHRSSQFNNYSNNSRLSHQNNKKVFKEANKLQQQERAKSMQMKTQMLMKQHAILQQKIEANKRLMNETMMLSNLHKQKFAPLKVEDFEEEEEEKKKPTEPDKTEDEEEGEEEYDEEEEYYDEEEYDEETEEAACRKTPKKGTPKKG